MKPQLEDLDERLAGGDLDAYQKCPLCRRFLLESAALFDAKENGIIAVESLRSWNVTARPDPPLASMNVVGLVIVLFAGLPIGEDAKSACARSSSAVEQLLDAGGAVW